MLKSSLNQIALELQARLQTVARVETPLLETKVQLYRLDSQHDGFELIKDAIAMANTVRRIGQKGYLVFGIEDGTKRIIDQSTATVYPVPDRPGHELSLDKRMDRNEGQILDFLNKYISPSVDVQLCYGEIEGLENLEASSRSSPEDESVPPPPNRGVVIWMEFSHTPPKASDDRPYVVKKDFHFTSVGEGGAVTLKHHRAGDAWTRLGARNSGPLRGEAQHALTSAAQVPWIDNGSWLGYAQRPPVPKPKFYTPLHAHLGGYDQVAAGTPASDALAMLHEWLNEIPATNLYVEGTIGAGKTSLLLEFQGELLERLEQEVAALAHFSECPPRRHVPIFASCYGQVFGDAQAVSEHVLEQANVTGALGALFSATRSSPEWRRKIFDCPEYRFLVILDALDEMEDEGDWIKSFRSIRRFCDAHRATMRVIVSAREGTPRWSGSSEGWSQLTLAPLSEDQIRLATKKLIDRDAFWSVVRGNPSLSALLRMPLTLSHVLDFCDQQESKAQREGETAVYDPALLVHEVVRVLLMHESRKDTQLDRDNVRVARCRGLAALAWKLDGAANDAPFTLVQQLLGDQWRRVAQTGILTRGRGEDTWCFATLLLKAYFAARHVLDLARMAVVDPSQVNWNSELQGVRRGAELWRTTSQILLYLASSDEYLHLAQSPFFEATGQVPQWMPALAE